MASQQVNQPSGRAESPPLHAPLVVAVGTDAHNVVVSPSGELDLSSAPTLQASLDHVMADSLTPVVVDLGGLTFIDSSGLIVLVGAYTRLTDAGRPFQVRNPTPAVRRVLALSGLDALLADAS